MQALAVLGLPVAAAEGRVLSASDFWDLYFNDAFLRLTRAGTRWSGVATVSGRGLSVRDALRPQAEESVWISSDALRRHNDAGDARFDIFSALDMSSEAAGQAVVQGQYPYRSAPPFSPQRMGTVMVELRRAALDTASGVSELTVSVLARWLGAAIDAPGALTDQRITAAAWFLGERRDGAGGGALLELLASADRAQVSSSASDAAYAALWKIADGAVLAPLCAQMERASETARWKYAKLFERLLSTDTMLSSSQLGDAYANPGSWSGLVVREKLSDPVAWKRLQARSLRWELRALQARRLAKGDGELARLLASDEVEAVRRAAQPRR